MTYATLDATKLKDLDYYRKVAKKQIVKLGGPIGKKMIKDEQAIGDVAYEIMLAEMKHDETKGRTRNSWLNQHAIYAIKDYITKTNRENKHSHSQLNEEITGEEINIASYENKQFINLLLEKSNLSERQKVCVTAHYLEGKTLKEISEQLGICRWAVTLNIRAGLEKLRKTAEQCLEN